MLEKFFVNKENLRVIERKTIELASVKYKELYPEDEDNNSYDILLDRADKLKLYYGVTPLFLYDIGTESAYVVIKETFMKPLH